MSPDAFLLRCVRWQLFTGMTFKREKMSERQRVSMVFEALRGLSELHQVPFPRLLFGIRLERGEHSSRRFHIHALVAGLPDSVVDSRTCFALMRLWKRAGGGWSRVRTWEAGADACSYMTKPPGWSFRSANDYESSKFGPGACQVILSKSAKTLGFFTRSMRYVHGEKNRRHNSEFARRRIQGRATSATLATGLNSPLPCPSLSEMGELKTPATANGARATNPHEQPRASKFIHRGDGLWVLVGNRDGSQLMEARSLTRASVKCDESGSEKVFIDVRQVSRVSESSEDHVRVQELGCSFGEFSQVSQFGDKPRGQTPGHAD